MMKQKKNNHNNHWLLGGCLALLALLALVGCGENQDEQKMKAYIRDVNNRQSRGIDPIPHIQEYPRHQYPNDHKRDPFMLPQLKKQATGLQPDKKRPKQPLEFFPLDALRMVGVLHKGAKTWAIIAAPDQTVYRITMGEYIGQNYGRVVKIGKDAVHLVETVKIHDNWERRPASLALTKPDEK